MNADDAVMMRMWRPPPAVHKLALDRCIQRRSGPQTLVGENVPCLGNVFAQRKPAMFAPASPLRVRPWTNIAPQRLRRRGPLSTSRPDDVPSKIAARRRQQSRNRRSLSTALVEPPPPVWSRAAQQCAVRMSS
ncbi:hypothetical protein MRX96_010666 [Rhipicephalus microplus]